MIPGLGRYHLPRGIAGFKIIKQLSERTGAPPEYHDTTKSKTAPPAHPSEPRCSMTLKFKLQLLDVESTLKHIEDH